MHVAISHGNTLSTIPNVSSLDIDDEDRLIVGYDNGRVAGIHNWDLILRADTREELHHRIGQVKVLPGF